MQDTSKVLHFLQSYYTHEINKYSFKLSEAKEIEDIIEYFEKYKNAKDCLNTVQNMIGANNTDESQN